MNSCTLSGNVANSPELRYTSEGTPVLSFRVAVPNWHRKDGDADFVSCSMFGERAQKVADFLRKGTPVSLIARVSCRPWEDKNGSRHEGVGFVIQEIDVHHRAPKGDVEIEAA